MFPEYREVIEDLKNTDSRFMDLFQKHGALDQKIRNMECHAELGTHEEIEILKKEKLLIKDRIFAMARKAQSGRLASA
jgi:hypothetical protein